MRDCPQTKTTQEVQAVKGEDGGPEVLFIGQTVMHEREDGWRKVKAREPRQPTLGDFIKKPPGLCRRPVAKGYKILEVDDEEEEEPEVMNIRCVECEPVVSWRQKVADEARPGKDKPKHNDLSIAASISRMT